MYHTQTGHFYIFVYDGVQLFVKWNFVVHIIQFKGELYDEMILSSEQHSN